ncbi:MULTISPECIES: hypothetical protein [Sphingobium]|uniref:DUF4148 domain-containing protein n=1 Tax=Sphingobium yanoikuyae TaxID=13690 RepID=A0A9X7U983_SPHYA|nr:MULTISPECIES: hypothetical protein [Sphingobium]PZU63821.1 MAG: hypothetical protein DI540_22930 [Sphingobium sp.]QNG44239.1 hypothetical protein H3V42_20460 [Sphingobium yanoikuyae]
MRIPLALPSLFLTALALPAALPAQIARKTEPTAPPGPVNVRVEPRPSGDYELERARQDIRDGRKSGTLSRKQARALRREADRADAQADRSARDGLSYSEQREIDMQGRALQSLTEAQRSQPGRKRP